MAGSNAHKFGQIVGALIEISLKPKLQVFANSHGLYLDFKGRRKARGKKVLCKWSDIDGNDHDLDFVLERAGTSESYGNPVAFIESAWRRATKHSKNKVQEMQGAINPIVKMHESSVCFKGVILAGDWTDPSIRQLVRDKFAVLYFPTKICIAAFEKFGLKIKSNDATTEDEYAERITKWDTFTQQEELAVELLELNEDAVTVFLTTLKQAISRSIKQITVIPLHGESFNVTTIESAVEFLQSYAIPKEQQPLLKIEMVVRYDNESIINAVFTEKDQAITFLETLRPKVLSTE